MEQGIYCFKEYHKRKDLVNVMERARQIKRMKQIIGDTCIYAISFIAAAVFIVEILNWMMTVWPWCIVYRFIIQFCLPELFFTVLFLVSHSIALPLFGCLANENCFMGFPQQTAALYGIWSQMKGYLWTPILKEWLSKEPWVSCHCVCSEAQACPDWEPYTIQGGVWLRFE